MGERVGEQKERGAAGEGLLGQGSKRGVAGGKAARQEKLGAGWQERGSWRRGRRRGGAEGKATGEGELESRQQERGSWRNENSRGGTGGKTGGRAGGAPYQK